MFRLGGSEQKHRHVFSLLHRRSCRTVFESALTCVSFPLPLTLPTHAKTQMLEVLRAEAGQLEFQRQRDAPSQQVDKGQGEIRLVDSMRQMTGLKVGLLVDTHMMHLLVYAKLFLYFFWSPSMEFAGVRKMMHWIQLKGFCISKRHWEFGRKCCRVLKISVATNYIVMILSIYSGMMWGPAIHHRSCGGLDQTQVETHTRTHTRYRLSGFSVFNTAASIFLTAEHKQMTAESPYWSVGLHHKPRVTFANSAGGGSNQAASTTEEARTRMVCLNSSSPSESTLLNCKWGGQRKKYLETSALSFKRTWWFR